MNAVVIAIFGLSAFSLAYRFYGRYLAETVFGSEGPEAEGFVTPAHEKRDDADFIPTRTEVLFGHHFTSIAGAGPIVGPAIAVIWGWVPAVLWIVLGAVFIGAVHDFGALVVSVRGGGRSMAEITGDEVGGRARLLFLLLILFLTWIVLAVFAYVIASLFVDYPASVLPINFEILVAMVLGWGVTKKGWSLLGPSLVALVLLYVMIFVGVKAPIVTHRAFLSEAHQSALVALQPELEESAERRLDMTRVKPLMRALEARGESVAELRDAVGAARRSAVAMWMFLLLGYAFVASTLPVWLLLQPRDYINSHQLFVGLGGLYLGLLILHPPVVAPAFVPEPPGARSWLPFLFVTIACGAVSGFHGLISSGTSSKQLDRLEDARPVAYRAMLGEASLGLIVTLACVAGFRSADAWSAHYQSWAAAGSLDRKLDAFLQGGGWFLTGVGLPETVGMVIIAVIVISFAATTLDSAARVQRFVLAELGEGLGGPARVLTKVPVGAFLACASPLILLNAKGEGGKPLWASIWPIFGAANQLLAALTLLVLTLWLRRRRRPVWPTAIPFLIIAGLTLTAFAGKLATFWQGLASSGYQKGRIVFATTLILLAFGAWILVECLLSYRSGKAPTEDPNAPP